MCAYYTPDVKDIVANSIKKIRIICTSTMLINHFWNSTSSPLSFHDQIEGAIVPPLAHQHRTPHALRRAKVAGWMALGKVGFEGWQPWHPVDTPLPVTPKEIEQFGTAFVNKRFCLEGIEDRNIKHVIRELRSVILGEFFGLCKMWKSELGSWRSL